MKEKNLNQSLKKLSSIAEWFEDQEEIDVEAGLAKVKEAADIIKEAKQQFKDVENQFEEIKKEMEKDSD